MLFRFRVLSPSNTGSPDYLYCNQTSSVLSYSNLSLTIRIDDEQVYTTTDLATDGFTFSTTTSNNNLTVAGLGILNTDYLTIRIPLNNYWDSTTVHIKLEKSGVVSYENLFQVYGYDLGNNPNVNNNQGDAVDYNPSMDIYMVPTANNVVNNKETKAFSAFTSYRKPYSKQVHIYSTTSTNGTIEYFDDNNILLTTGKSTLFQKSDNLCIKQKISVYGTTSNNCAPQLLDSCTTNEQTIEKLVLFPPFNVTIDCTNECNNDCISVITENTLVTNIDYSLVNKVFSDDTRKFPFTEQKLNYYIVNSQGFQIDNKEYTITTPDNLVYNPTLFDWENFLLSEIGDHSLITELSIENVFKCRSVKHIKSCHWYEIEQTKCSEYKVHNRSSTELTLKIYKLEDDKSFKLETTKTIDSFSYVLSSHTEDGVYKYEVIRESKTMIYNVINYCKLRKCLASKIKKVICSDPCKQPCNCNDVDDLYNFNSLSMLAYTFFNMLNTEYSLNFMYNAIDDQKLEQLYEMSNILKRIGEYCNECK